MNKKTFIWLTGIVLFAIILRLTFFSGIGASDDLTYTRYAYEASQNSYSFPANHHGTRLGLIYPVGFLYNMFGVNEFSSNIFVFLVSIAGIVLLFYFGKIFFNEKVGLTAAFLLSFFPLDVVFATKLLSDFPSAFFLGLSVFFFLLGEKSLDKIKARLSYLLSGISIGIAYTIRETTLLLLLFFLAYVIFYKKIKVNYGLIFIGFVIIFAIETGVFYLNTGDLLYRSHSHSAAYESVLENAGPFRGTFPSSLFHYPYILLTGNNLGFFYIFVFLVSIYFVVMKRKQTYPFMLWLWILLSYLSFGTSSLTQYVPFPGAARYLAIVTIPALLLLAVFLTEKELIIKKVFMPSILALLFISSLGFLYLGKGDNVGSLKDIQPYIAQLDKPVYTDGRSKSVLEYSFQYEPKVILKAFSIREGGGAEAINLSGIKDAYIIINKELIQGVMDAHKFISYDVPEEVYNPPENWKIIKEINKEIILYYVS